jgi:hypothetical protein
MRLDNNQEAFFALLKAGLWDTEVELAPYGELDYSEIYRLAEEQSVVGLVAAGLEHATDVKPSKSAILPFLTQVIVLEQHNQAMNNFIAKIVAKMREAGIYTILVKGQGVAQCYERPLWRACGDVDFLLSDPNYEQAKSFLMPLATEVEDEDRFKKHIGMTIDQWVVELHGTMYTQLSRRVNKGVNAVQNNIFVRGEVRSWQNGDTTVFLPSADNDILLVFTHFLNHFFVGGVGLRQICDWCRLLWTYKDKIDVNRLEMSLKKMGVLSEWKAFSAFAVEYLGMPEDTMPLYSSKYKVQGSKILRVVLEAGNFGHNKDNTYRSQYKRIRSHLITFVRRTGEFFRLASIFPVDAPKFFIHYMLRRLKKVV